MTRETRNAKAERLVKAGRVDLLMARAEDHWSAVVEGDTDTYYVSCDPEGRWCECPHGASARKCSHFLAGEAVVFGQLALSERSSL